jgi:hypothetical protein
VWGNTTAPQRAGLTSNRLSYIGHSIAAAAVHHLRPFAIQFAASIGGTVESALMPYEVMRRHNIMAQNLSQLSELKRATTGF